MYVPVAGEMNPTNIVRVPQLVEVGKVAGVVFFVFFYFLLYRLGYINACICIYLFGMKLIWNYYRGAEIELEEMFCYDM